ncbi:cytochrome P450 67 [Didymella exigua CBS 183.55]|uniref:Cytochrome P450 67 n=1 Tax=Didymella exigua CBS 183.55 TaxID=1150837 RepID=A0A6A5RZD1_9PLEO|nr:cytochrome P450 67 [Didymella exigua CBS 183.55]KAF1933771.1 cytochrome P450 67 [Didymella exigua CBS 183.55]
MGFTDVAGGLSYPNVFALSAASFVAYILITAAYRLYFHPLASFPGPFWAKLSTFPAWWHSKNQDRHLWHLILQEQYGPEYRYAPNSVCLNTPSAYRHIFGPKGNVKKSEYYSVWPKTEHHINTWDAVSVPAHARKRRVINYAFSESALREAEVFVHANVDRWLVLLGRDREKGDLWTRSINMADQVTYLVFDILGDLCFGKCFDMKEPDSKLRHVPELMIGFMELVHPIGCSPISSLYIWLKPRGLDRLLAAVTPPAIQKWTEFVDDCLAKRTSKQRELEEKPRSEAEVRKDFFHWLFNAKDPETGTGYSLPELYAECELLIVAGSDTTAIVISAAYFYLSRNPSVQEKLALEIHSTFNSYEEIKAGPKLQSCNYMTAFLMEAMRMSPPVPAEPSREVLPGGTTVNGHYFPQGSLISTAFWAMHYNQDYYPEPLKFRPERWIVGEAGSTADSVALGESAFCAFSTGSRGCVGKNMAWLEMRIVLAKTLWKFEIRRDANGNLGGGSADARPGRREEGQYQTYEMFVSNRKGPMVQLKERVH